MNWMKTLATISKTAKKYAPTMLSVAGACGVVVTGISAAKAGREDMTMDIKASNAFEPPEERRKRKIRTYAKPVIFGAASIGCILAGDRLHARRYIALGAAASVIQDRYDRLSKQLRMTKTSTRDENGNLIEGKGTADASMKDIMDTNEAERIYWQCQEAGIHPYDTHSGNDLWYESFSKTWFFASEKHVDDAGYNLNRNFHLRGESPFSEYLRFLELPVGDHPMYDKFHWNLYEGEVYYGYSWVDFMYAKKRLANGLEYTHIFYPFEPHLGEE